MSTVKNKLALRSNETEQEIITSLNQFGRCAMIRPTGFGKTYLMCKVIKTGNYHKILYVFPTQSVKEQALKYIAYHGIPKESVKFSSYAYLSRNVEKAKGMAEHINKNFDLIIFDEIHHMGADRASKTIKTILDNIDLSKCHILGGTATPKRMDSFDVLSEFFKGYMVTKYYINEAIDDGLMQKPYYVHAPENIEVVLRGAKKVFDKLDEAEQQKSGISLEKTKLALAKLVNVSDIIKESIKTVYGEIPSYMKFIVFMPNIETINNKAKDIYKWFMQAFPNREVRITVIHSKLSNYIEALTKLDNLTTKDGIVDVIISVNMLNEGYHVDNITGVILLRSTRSPSLYIQQIGRCMTIGATNRPIILDLVDNINISSLFGLDRADSEVTNSYNDSDDSDNDSISKMNIELIDRIADIKKFIAKIEDVTKSDVSALIVHSRQNNAMSVWLIHQIHKIAIPEILRAFKNNGIPLLEVDRFIWDNKGPTDKLIPKFDEYLKMV